MIGLIAPDENIDLGVFIAEMSYVVAHIAYALVGTKI